MPAAPYKVISHLLHQTFMVSLEHAVKSPVLHRSEMLLTEHRVRLPSLCLLSAHHCLGHSGGTAPASPTPVVE